MLETGNLWGALADAEGRSHFSMWAAMKVRDLKGVRKRFKRDARCKRDVRQM
jgi:hypothetical protein